MGKGNYRGGEWELDEGLEVEGVGGVGVGALVDCFDFGEHCHEFWVGVKGGNYC